MTIARFGSRYGSKVRKNVLAVESKYKYQKQICPYCGKESVKRQSAGIFKCENCIKEFAGGAYETETLGKKTIINKMFDKVGRVARRGATTKTETKKEKVKEESEDKE
jgi:large subunit ribosomal protein L37Ae